MYNSLAGAMSAVRLQRTSRYFRQSALCQKRTVGICENKYPKCLTGMCQAGRIVNLSGKVTFKYQQLSLSSFEGILTCFLIGRVFITCRCQLIRWKFHDKQSGCIPGFFQSRRCVRRINHCLIFLSDRFPQAAIFSLRILVSDVSSNYYPVAFHFFSLHPSVLNVCFRSATVAGAVADRSGRLFCQSGYFFSLRVCSRAAASCPCPADGFH
ncbi:hypothetical protein AI2884V1_3124 [Serratia marcescens]|nr:hypothetical protein AI2872V1_3124 [Serratia marcescens]CAF2681863.1 hypothetical protein AI2884V1_3124 [Serratia marcescens]CAH5329606.1 hypothetical protein AI2872V1_3124 [Serratia marcescens]CAH5364174.1 hypothetical protein AI2884V1_3124 [Serratia marcescens]